MTKTKMTDEQRKEARRLASKKWYETHKKAKTVYGTTPEAAAKIAKPAVKRGRPAKKAVNKADKAAEKKAEKKAAKLAVLKAKLKDAKAAEKAAWREFRMADKTYQKLNRKWEKAAAAVKHLKAKFLDLG